MGKVAEHLYGAFVRRAERAKPCEHFLHRLQAHVPVPPCSACAETARAVEGDEIKFAERGKPCKRLFGKYARIVRVQHPFAVLFHRIDHGRGGGIVIGGKRQNAVPSRDDKSPARLNERCACVAFRLLRERQEFSVAVRRRVETDGRMFVAVRLCRDLNVVGIEMIAVAVRDKTVRDRGKIQPVPLRMAHGIRVKIEEQRAVEERLLAGADVAPAGKTRLSAYGALTEQCRHTLVRRRSEVFQFHISLRSISFSAFCRTLFSAPTARRNARAMTMLPILPGCTLSHVIKAG